MMLTDFWKHKTLLFSLSLNDFKSKYAGSYFGIVWAFVQPLTTIFVFWFVFQIGLRARSSSPGVPFVLWLVAGLVPWFFFSDGVLSGTSCFFEYSYLVKKVVFKVSLLPMVKILSSLYVHVAFIVLLIVVELLYGFHLTWYTLQLGYYTICTFVLVLGITLISAPIVVFFRDLGQIVAIGLQFGMWLTPIMWSQNLVPSSYRWIFKANPMYYIVSGYRESLIQREWFFQTHLHITLYFWAIVLVFLLIGTGIFKRLKVHFADVL